jgi:hypothetical protein
MNFIFNENFLNAKDKLLTLLAWWVEILQQTQELAIIQVHQLILLDKIYSLCVTPINLTWHETSQILYKWIPISSLFKKLLLKLSANGFPYFFFVQELLLSSSLQIGTHVFYFQDFYETTSCKSNSWTNQIYSKLHKINPSLKL